MSHRPYFNPLTNPMGSPGEHRNAYPRTPQAMASQSVPAAMPPPPHRDIGSDETREVTFKPFNIQVTTSGATGAFTPEVTVASLNKPHSAVDVYLSLVSYAGALHTTDYFEVAVTLYAVTGQTRAPIARGAYSVSNTSTDVFFDRSILIAAARTGAERFDITVRCSGNTVNAAIVGSIAAIGYDAPALPATRSSFAHLFLFAGVAAAVQRPIFFIGRRAQLLGYAVFNPGVSTTFLQWFDVANSATIADGTRPLDTIAVPAGGQVIIDLRDKPREFYTGIFWQSSSNPSLMTAAGALSLVVQNVDYV